MTVQHFILPSTYSSSRLAHTVDVAMFGKKSDPARCQDTAVGKEHRLKVKAASGQVPAVGLYTSAEAS